MGPTRVFAALAVLCCAAVAPATARGGSFTFTASGDAAVSSSAPFSNYGSSSSLRAGSAPTWRSYLRFPVANLGGGRVTRATLQLYPTASSSTGVAVRSASSSWSESTITYANVSAPTVAVGDPVSGPVSYGAWLSVDVTRFVAGTGTINLALTRDATLQLSFAAREAGTTFAPRLVVDTQDADLTPPSAPASLAAPAVSGTQVGLTWAPSTDNVGVTGYRVLRNGIQVAAPSTTAYTDTGLTPATTYSYVVKAVDAAGNLSAGSAALAVTTWAPPPPPPPPPSSVRTFTFVPIADAYVDSAAPSTSFGTATTLRAAAAPVRQSYVRFSVTGLGLAATKATLRLKLTQPVGDFVVSRVGDTGWAESITYATAPAVSAASGDPHAQAAAAGSVDIDVTPFVTGNGPVSLALTTTGATELVASSREAGSASAPQLIVQTPSVAPDGSLAWPISAAFYYPWFPEGWNQQGYRCGAAPSAGLPPTPSGCFTWYSPSLGFYSLDGVGADGVVDSHIRALVAAGQEAAVSSWWGQGTPTDSRVPRLLSRTHALGSPLKWALYYELEGYGSPTIAQIQSDLAYIKQRYAGDSAYLRVGGQPVLFVYSADDADCSVGQKWVQANQPYGFHLVLKVVTGYRTCNLGIDWHQYAGGTPTDLQKGFSYTITPGFWQAGQASPVFARDPARWAQNVADMRAANVHWRLVTTFNEWGEGTAVESAREWASPSGYGTYVDALRPSP